MYLKVKEVDSFLDIEDINEPILIKSGCSDMEAVKKWSKEYLIKIIGDHKFNFEKAKTFLNVCFKNGIDKVIFSSTASVYGNPRREKVLESDPLNPLNPYADSKLVNQFQPRFVYSHS